MKAALRFSLLVFAGLTLLQSAWIITMPPFRGIDEFDHVFRAVGVAEGQWRLSTEAPEGRGLLVAVPSDVVEAASAQCDALEYTGRDNCFPVEELPNGLVTISTAAGAYHPAYYFVVGSVGQFFAGAGADYAMRVTSALLSAIGVATAAFCLGLAGAGRWSRFGFLASLTPVAVYTLTLPAPNSIEIVAGLCLWTASIGFLRERADRQHGQIFLLVATVAGSVLATVRTMGPMWLALIVATTLVWAGWTDVRAAVLRHRWYVVVASVVVMLAASAGAWWSMNAQLFAPPEPLENSGATVEVELGLQPMVWVLQIIAAFPLRNEVAPPAVYAAYVLVVAALFIAGLCHSQCRKRFVQLASAMLVACLPLALTFATVETHGVIWQGRYGLPFAVGVTVLSGLALDDHAFAPREGVRLRAIGCALLAAAHMIGIAQVVAKEHANEVSVADNAWLAPHSGVVVALVAAGWLIWALSVVGPGGSARAVQPERPLRERRQSVGR